MSCALSVVIQSTLCVFESGIASDQLRKAVSSSVERASERQDCDSSGNDRSGRDLCPWRGSNGKAVVERLKAS
jgi:hypothetical protein